MIQKAYPCTEKNLKKIKDRTLDFHPLGHVLSATASFDGNTQDCVLLVTFECESCPYDEELAFESLDDEMDHYGPRNYHNTLNKNVPTK